MPLIIIKGSNCTLVFTFRNNLYVKSHPAIDAVAKLFFVATSACLLRYIGKKRKNVVEYTTLQGKKKEKM